jgi:uncharacterized protein
MKYIHDTDMHQLEGTRIAPSQNFAFRCRPTLECFNRCCHNLNLFLYPYDVLRLRKALGISSDAFIEQHVDIVLRPGHFFPEVLLRMADTQGQPCIFLTPDGCRVYADRPHTCRLFPIEQGAYYDAATGKTAAVHYFRPPAFCQGPSEPCTLDIETYIREQGARDYCAMNLAWAQLRRLFENDPWGGQGPQGPKAKMAFMATYNIDLFRDFVFNSSYLKRYKVASALAKKMRTDDAALLLFGFEWVKVFVWGLRSPQLQPR